MKKLMISSLLMILGCVSHTHQDNFAHQKLVREQSIEWTTDIDKSTRSSKSTNKPIILYFYQEDCEWCQLTNDTTLEHERVKKLINEKFVALKLDVRKNSKFAYASGVTIVPMFVVLTVRDDNVVIANTRVGFLDRDRFMLFLEESLRKIESL